MRFVQRINHCYEEQNVKPLVFTTLINQQLGQNDKTITTCILIYLILLYPL